MPKKSTDLETPNARQNNAAAANDKLAQLQGRTGKPRTATDDVEDAQIAGTMDDWEQRTVGSMSRDIELKPDKDILQRALLKRMKEQKGQKE